MVLKYQKYCVNTQGSTESTKVVTFPKENRFKSMKLLLLFLTFSTIGYSQETDTATIYFGVDESIPNTKQAFEPFDKNSRIVRIEAHCDTSASAHYNKQLAQTRLEYTKKELVGLGYSIDKAETIAFGETMAAKHGWSKHDSRRVDIIYIEPAIEEVPDPNPTDIEKYGGLPERGSGIHVDDSKEFSQKNVEDFIADPNADELKMDMTILFYNASAQVLPESRPQLLELLEIMKKYPELNAEIHGHVCCQPHQEISDARARTVCMFLIDNKISNKRLKYEGHSNTQPKVWPELTEEDQKMNRRVVVVLKK